MLGIQQNLLPDLPDYETAVNDPRYAKKPPLDPSSSTVASAGANGAHGIHSESNLLYSNTQSTMGLPPPPPYSAAIAAEPPSTAVLNSLPVPEVVSSPPQQQIPPQQQQQHLTQAASPSPPTPPSAATTTTQQQFGSEIIEIPESVITEETSPSSAAPAVPTGTAAVVAVDNGNATGSPAAENKI